MGDSKIDTAFRANLSGVTRAVSCGRIDIPGTDEFTVQHTLNSIPDLYWYVPWSTGLTIARGTTPWTETSIYLVASGAGTIELFVVKL